MWLPKAKYKVKYAKKGDMQNEDGTDYVGPYMEAYDGVCYAGTEFSKNTKELVRCELTGSSDVMQNTVNTKFEPTEEDYDRGKVTRYFRQNKATKKIEELSEQSYSELYQGDSYKTYTFATCSWILTGSLEDIDFNQNVGNSLPYTYRGVSYRNSQSISELNEIIPGVADTILTDPAEKVRNSSKSL